MPGLDLPALTPELRERAGVAASRRLALSSQNQLLRLRYDEVMQWLNPPWDERSRRADPRPELNNARTEGRPRIHVDWVGEAVERWAVLQIGSLPAFRFVPRYVPPLAPADPEQPPEQREYELKLYEIDRAEAEGQASQMEAQTREWLDFANAHRTLLWACWAKEAFGKAVLRSGWDNATRMATLELLENPSQCYYAWTTRYGNRKLAWMVVADQMQATEVNARYGLDLPVDADGLVRYGEWTGGLGDATSDMDQRPEQAEENARFVWVEESWELLRDDDGDRVRQDFIVAGRIISSETWPWHRLPFHILENRHIATWGHGDSLAESVIPLNEAYDDLLDRQHVVIDFESGPRYKGINFGIGSDADYEVPAPGMILPLREGEDVQQIDTRVDFWPSQLHANELKESLYFGSGLTPIAWGMSPNAQTSGRALSAEWRAVQLPLTARLIELTPTLIEFVSNWWDFAEAYVSEAKQVGQGYRRVQVIWEPLDIRDQSERVLSVIQLYQADLMDPETALEQTGHEDVPEKLALIRRYLTDPVWNPLRYQQMLVLKQLALSIEQQEMQTQAMRQQGQPQGGAPGEAAAGEMDALEQQGINAASANAQGPAGPVSEGQNQPGMSPSLPLDVSTLSRTPLEQGVGNQVVLGLGGAQGATPTEGLVPR